MTKKTPNPTDKHVGERVRMRRLMLNMTQTDLADGLGLTFQQVQKYEKGANRIGASRLQHIATILQVPVSFFFDGAPKIPGALNAFGGTPTPPFAQAFLATSEGIALMKAYMKIKDLRIRGKLVELLETYVASR